MFHGVLPPYLHHLFPHHPSLRVLSLFPFSPSSVVFLHFTSEACQGKSGSVKRFGSIASSFHLRYYPLLFYRVNSSYPKIVYKSTLTVKLSPFSVASPCLSEDYNNTFYLCFCPYYRLSVITLIYIFFILNSLLYI